MRTERARADGVHGAGLEVHHHRQEGRLPDAAVDMDAVGDGCGGYACGSDGAGCDRAGSDGAGGDGAGCDGELAAMELVAMELAATWSWQ